MTASQLMTLKDMEVNIRNQREDNQIGTFQTYGRVCVFYRQLDDLFEVTRLNGYYVGATRNVSEAAQMAFDVISQ